MTQSCANSDDEASDLHVLREYPGKFDGKNNDVILAGRYGFLAGRASLRAELPALISEAVAKERKGWTEFETNWGRVECHDGEKVTFPNYMPDGWTANVVNKRTRIRIMILNPTPEVKSE